MIGMMGILGYAIASAVISAVCAIVTVGLGADAAAKQKAAQDKAEAQQEKSLNLQKHQNEKKRMRARRAAATGMLASIIEAKRNKYQTDATYRKMTRIEASNNVIGHARVNRSNYHYGTPVRS